MKKEPLTRIEKITRAGVYVAIIGVSVAIIGVIINTVAWLHPDILAKHKKLPLDDAILPQAFSKPFPEPKPESKSKPNDDNPQKDDIFVTQHTPPIVKVTPKDFYEQGVKYFKRGQFNEAINSLEQSALSDYTDAQYYLGFIYMHANEICNTFEAVKWLRKAAMKNHPSAQFELGQAYLYDKGVEKNLIEAENWLDKAAQNGNQKAKDLMKQIFN